MKKINRTDKAIFDSFYKYRKQYPLNKIKVTSICDDAEVNKSTFYNRYVDIYDLSYKLEDILIDDSFNNFDVQHLIYKQPSTFIKEFKKCLSAHTDEYMILGNGREKELLHHIEDKLFILFENDLKKTDKEFISTFVIGGASHVLERFILENKKYSIDDVEQQLSSLIETILSIYDKKTKSI